jgi:hypothetical protein
MFFQLYNILDIFSRYVVGRLVADRESEALAVERPHVSLSHATRTLRKRHSFLSRSLPGENEHLHWTTFKGRAQRD